MGRGAGGFCLVGMCGGDLAMSAIRVIDPWTCVFSLPYVVLCTDGKVSTLPYVNKITGGKVLCRLRFILKTAK